LATSESLGSQTEFYDAEERLNSTSEETEVSSYDVISSFGYRVLALQLYIGHYVVLFERVNSLCIIRLHQMQTIVTDDCSVCPSVCLSRSSARLYCAKMAEQIKMLFGVNTPKGPWNNVL